MPITITPPQPLNTIGPGIFVQFQSDFVGPPAIGFWQFDVTISNTTTEQTIYTGHVAGTANPMTSDMVMNPLGNWHYSQDPTVMPKDGDEVTIQVSMRDGSTVDDTGTLTVPFDSQTGLNAYINYWLQKIQGQIPADQSTEIQQILTNTNQQQTDWQQYTSVTLPSLQDVLNNIIGGITTTITGVGGAVASTLGQLFSGRTLDLLTTADLGTACAPKVLDVSLSGGTFFGIQMECTSYADWYVFTGPGDTYTTQSLGTLEILRGGNVMLRLGLHTTTHMVYPLPGIPGIEVVSEVTIVPPDYRVTLTPAPETCWHLVALEMP